jgi:homoserine kinase type II
LPERHAYGLETFPSLLDQGVNFAYEKWLAQRYEILQHSIHPGLPRGLIHGDVFYDNVLFDRKTLKAVIDFEEACHYYKVFDLGMAAVGVCTEKSKLLLSKVRSLVRGYQNNRRLELAEIESLQLFVDYAATATSSWRFWMYNIDTPIAEKSKRHLDMVNIADACSEISSEIFMDAVFS